MIKIIYKGRKTPIIPEKEALQMKLYKLRSRITTVNSAIYHNCLNGVEKDFIQRQEVLRDKLIRQMQKLETIINNY